MASLADVADLDEPGRARYLTDLHLYPQPQAGSVRLTTATRVPCASA